MSEEFMYQNARDAFFWYNGLMLPTSVREHLAPPVILSKQLQRLATETSGQLSELVRAANAELWAWRREAVLEIADVSILLAAPEHPAFNDAHEYFSERLFYADEIIRKCLSAPGGLQAYVETLVSAVNPARAELKQALR